MEPEDVVGHGTACAGIVHALAPDAELVSVRVLGGDNRGNGGGFATGLEWAIEASGASIVNLSLSSRSDAFFAPLHELADEAYFRNVLLVSAANNLAVASYPSLYAAVVSVAAHDVPSAEAWFYNPQPPVEFGAHGLNVDVAWRNGARMTVDRQQLRRAAHRRAGGADPGGPPGDHAVRDEDAARGHRRQRHLTDMARRPTPSGRPSPGRPSLSGGGAPGQRSPCGFLPGPFGENSPSVVGPMWNRWPSTSLPSASSLGIAGRGPSSGRAGRRPGPARSGCRSCTRCPSTSLSRSVGAMSPPVPGRPPADDAVACLGVLAHVGLHPS